MATYDFQERMRRVDDQILLLLIFQIVAGARQKTGIHYPLQALTNEQLICG